MKGTGRVNKIQIVRLEGRKNSKENKEMGIREQTLEWVRYI